MLSAPGRSWRHLAGGSPVPVSREPRRRVASVASAAGNGTGEAYTASMQGEYWATKCSESRLPRLLNLPKAMRGRALKSTGLARRWTAGVGDLIMYAQMALEPGKPMQELDREAEGRIARDDRSGAIRLHGWLIGV